MTFCLGTVGWVNPKEGLNRNFGFDSSSDEEDEEEEDTFWGFLVISSFGAIGCLGTPGRFTPNFGLNPNFESSDDEDEIDGLRLNFPIFGFSTAKLVIFGGAIGGSGGTNVSESELSDDFEGTAGLRTWTFRTGEMSKTSLSPVIVDELKELKWSFKLHIRREVCPKFRFLQKNIFDFKNAFILKIIFYQDFHFNHFGYIFN